MIILLLKYKDMEIIKKMKVWRIVIIITIGFVIAMSVILYLMRGVIFERFKQEISWATQIALAAVNPEHVSVSASLLGSDAFIESDDIKRLKEELEDLGSLFLPRGIDALYLLDKKGTEVYFLAESTPFGESGYVIPGALYREAPEAAYHVFSEKEPDFTDLYTDEYGTYFSEFTPVVDHDGVMVGALGVDVDHNYFTAYLLRARLLVFGIGLAIYLLIILVLFMFKRKSDSDDQIEESNRQIKSIIDSIPSSLVAFDENEKIVFWNHSCNEMFGLTSKEAYGRKINDIIKFKTVSEQISGRNIEGFSFSKAEDYPKKKLEFIMEKNEKEVIVEASFSFFGADKNKMVVALFDNVTDKKKKEKEVEEQRDKFEKMNSLMLDRELKMIELKSEIAKIKESCNK